MFAITLGLFIVNGANRIYEDRLKHREAQRASDAKYKRLHNLSEAEKQFLEEFLRLRSKSVSHASQSPIGQGLVLDELLLPPTVSRSGNMTYHMEFWVWEYLSSHPQLVSSSPQSK